MFAIPVQPDTNETHKALPSFGSMMISRISKAFICSLYSFGLPLKRLDSDTPLRVRGILKVADKYEVDSIHSRTIQHLKEDWPTSALAWLRFCRDEKLYSEDCARYLSLEDDTEHPEDHFPEPASAIRLARDLELSSIFPAALPHAHRAFLLDTQAGRSPDSNVVGDEEEDDGTPNCYQIILRKHDEFSAARYSSLWTGVEEVECLDPIAVPQEPRDAATNWKMCASCTELFRTKIADEIKRLWDDLPRIFGVVPEES
ncbi:uncharacterized protein PHACADRAFT_167708 [Phanerochaete carnosa HHB-10118-sp]|uniref:Uncharacterized protein n=1 Tax=Phanerochaete carnosa (strain HHB-10118-sp) TaxID=650164 RepID=K5XBK7_PHACS|nr:uncharacterized protein PHACADRAFT_167708 [Phanerochaete carnosa HHB-10118-sp]EKM60332.1 hypothetical protein PHACADRAFT_167708 [Phanerochaete carnosa HHB-10118-sp]